MELDFGPAEPPSQPPKNLPPSEGNGNVPTAEPPKPSGPPPLYSAPSSADATAGKQGKPLASSPSEGAPIAQASAIPVKPKGSGRKMLLYLGVLIIVVGLGYLAFTLFSQQGTPIPTDIPTLGSETITPTTPLPDATTSTTTTTTIPDTTSTPATTATETVQTRDTIRKKDLATIQTYLQSYFNDKGLYPTSAKIAKLNDSTSSVTAALVPKYTSALPRDPKDPEFFYGYKSVDGAAYTLSARLENTADPEGKQEGTLYLYTVSK